MSTVSPAATSPIRCRDGNNWDSHYWYPGNEYESANSPFRGPPPHAGAPPPGYFRGPHDFWPPEPQSGSAYWGPPPPFEDRHLPPPPRHTRAAPLPHQQRANRYEDSQQAPLTRVPTSPGGSYPRSSLQAKRDFRHPPTPRRGFQQGGTSSSSKDKKKGDALSILANVSAGMGGKDGKRAPQQHSHPVPIPAPTSPLQRRARPSPITPSQTPQDRQRSQRHQVTPISSNRPQEPPPSGSWEQPPEAGYSEYPPMAYYHPSRRRYLPHYNEYGPPNYHEGSPPVLVERGGSFDSQGDSPAYRDFAYPPTPPSGPGPYYYEDHHHSFGGYWDNGHPTQQGAYLPPRWNYGPPTDPYHSEYPYDAHEESFPQHHRSPPPHHAAPYTYVQQPRLEEKTILRKKFSWKHYPELERFLIANRDEYLKHSNMNYTAEQKQYNNWLTERLLEVAEQNHYVFDPDDFNFVAIRDRIRCYYKSYVQTARKRGLKLPEKKKD